MTTFADNRPEYADVWSEGRNHEAAALIRRRLNAGTATLLELQPGDGTRYVFVLTPIPDTVKVSSGGRMWEVQQVDDVPWFNGEPPLLVSIHPESVRGSGTAMISPHNGIDGIRHRIDEGMTIPNACTAEALAQAILAVWSTKGALHAV